MELENHIKLYVKQPDFLKKNFLPQKLGKWTKTGTKTGFFEFAEIYGH